MSRLWYGKEFRGCVSYFQLHNITTWLSGQVQAMIFIVVVSALATEREDQSRSSCGSHITPMNYTCK